MKKIWILSLFACSILVAGCNNCDCNCVNENEALNDIVAYCIDHWWTHTLIENDIGPYWKCDFPNGVVCEDQLIWTDLCNPEKNPEIIDDCVTVDWEDSCAIDIDEPVVEEPIVEEAEPSEIEKLKQSFEWIVINGKVDENQLSSSQPNTIQFNIEWKNTLYFLDGFWLAFTLWKEWEWWKIENAYEWKYLASVWLMKDWNKTYWFFLIDNEYYHLRQENPEPDEELVWENNKYHIVMRTVKNWGKDWPFDLVVYDVE